MDQLPLMSKWLHSMINRGLRGGAVIVSLGREKRSNDQNAKQWPMLEDICKKLPEWPRADGTLCKMTPQKYKDMLTASLFGTEFCLSADQRSVVAFGVRTSKLSKPLFSQLIEFYYSFGAQHDVEWSEPSIKVFDEYPELRAA